jgi:ATP-binding cassette subfamily D (ALD) long-chain fatty acid import protein
MYIIPSRRTKILLLSSSSFSLIVYLLRRYRRYLKNRVSKQESAPVLSSISVNKRFLNQLIVLIRILIPRLRSDSFVLLVTHLTTLISRTFLSIYIARLDGTIVKSLVQRNARDFLRSISIFLLVSIPASFINSLIRFAESKLALAFRSKLIRYAYQSYFRVRFPLSRIFLLF